MANLNPYLSEKQIEELREVFTSFDENKDGSLVLEEILHFLSTMGVEVSQEQIKALITDYDVDGNGAIQFNQFLPILTNYLTGSGELSEEELRVAFEMFDQNGDGLISNQELSHVLQQLGETTSPEDVIQFFEEADTNRDGLIDYQEFGNILKELV